MGRCLSLSSHAPHACILFDAFSKESAKVFLFGGLRDALTRHSLTARRRLQRWTLCRRTALSEPTEMPASLDWQDWRLETHDRELKKHNRELKEHATLFPEAPVLQDRSSTINSASAISVLHAADTNKSPEGPIAQRIHTAGSPSGANMVVAPIGSADSHLVQALSSSAAGALPALATFAKPFASSPSPVMPALASTVSLSGWARYSNSANDVELRSAMEDTLFPYTTLFRHRKSVV